MPHNLWTPAEDKILRDLFQLRFKPSEMRPFLPGRTTEGISSRSRRITTPRPPRRTEVRFKVTKAELAALRARFPTTGHIRAFLLESIQWTPIPKKPSPESMSEQSSCLSPPALGQCLDQAVNSLASQMISSTSRNGSGE